MNKQQQLFLIAILGITLMASAIAINIQPVDASRDGFDDGKRASASDYRNGKAFNDYCYSSNTFYCLAYKAGYRIGYEAEGFLRR